MWGVRDREYVVNCAGCEGTLTEPLTLWYSLKKVKNPRIRRIVEEHYRSFFFLFPFKHLVLVCRLVMTKLSTCILYTHGGIFRDWAKWSCSLIFHGNMPQTPFWFFTHRLQGQLGSHKKEHGIFQFASFPHARTLHTALLINAQLGRQENHLIGRRHDRSSV